MQKQLISTQIEQNEKAMKQAFTNCDDFKTRKISFGENGNIICFICYIEVSTGNNLINVLGRMLEYLDSVSEEQVIEKIKGNALDGMEIIC